MAQPNMEVLTAPAGYVPQVLEFDMTQPVEAHVESVAMHAVLDAGANETAVAHAGRMVGERGAISRKLGAVIAAGALAISAGGYFGFNALASDSKNARHVAPRGANVGKNTDPSCKNSKFVPEASNPTKFNTEAFFPHTNKLNNRDDVRTYTKDLFDGDGPLGQNIDANSLAVIMATVVKPSHDGAAVNPGYDYSKAFSDSLAEYNHEGGITAAMRDCTLAKDTLNQVADYDANWAQKGDTVTLFQAQRDTQNADKSKQNDIVGMVQVKQVTEETLSGIAMKLRDTSKGLDGFTEVLLTKDGKLYVKGVTVGEGQATQAVQIGPTGPQNNAKLGGNNQKNTNNNGNGGNQGQQNVHIVGPGIEQNGAAPGASTSGGGTFGNGGTNGEGNQAGQVPESGGSQGTTPGTQPSNGNGGSGGGQGGGGNGGGGGHETPTSQPPNTTPSTQPPTTATTRPPQTSTSTTRPPQTTTTTAPPPSTTPTTKGPDPCDPNVANC